MRNLKIIIVALCILMILFSLFCFRKPILKKIYRIEYYDYIEKYSKKYDVDEFLILAIIKAESNFNSNAVSKKGAKGLMQLMDSTAEDIAKDLKIDLNDNKILKPEINIELGTKYISDLIKKYNNIGLALAAYNAGSGNVDSWVSNGVLKHDGTNVENIPYIETNNYVRKILRDYEIYQWLYNK